jgi:hypothetical protein
MIIQALYGRLPFTIFCSTPLRTLTTPNRIQAPFFQAEQDNVAINKEHKREEYRPLIEGYLNNASRS